MPHIFEVNSLNLNAICNWGEILLAIVGKILPTIAGKILSTIVG